MHTRWVATPFAAVVGLLALPAVSAEPEGAKPRPAGEASSPVGLDALLQLPSGAVPGPGDEAQSGQRQRWEERFAAIRAELDTARANLAGAQEELEEIARSTESWQMAAPGARHDPETSPISFKLRNDIRRYREDVARAERRLRELEVEASLAGVPAEWRRPPHEDAAPGP